MALKHFKPITPSLRQLVIVDRSEVGSGWATETAATTETATPVIERISIKLHELAAMPKASQRLLDDSAFDVEGWLAEKIATRFIRACRDLGRASG